MNVQVQRRYREKREHLVIGLMSGTSLDGVDAALVAIETDQAGDIAAVRLQHFYYLPYSDELREWLAELCSPQTARIDRLTLAHFGLAEWYAHAVGELLEAAAVAPGEVDAICTHGQTVWHVAGRAPFPCPAGTANIRASLQIGELSTLAERTGIPVVGNFRSRDLAADGEGAPLVPYADYVLFRHGEKGRLLQNIGGIANVTVLPPGASIDDLVAFDTGPGNMVIDQIVQMATNGRQRFDEGGRMAAEGTVCAELLQELLADPYYRLVPPKSTGREMFGRAFAEKLWAEKDVRGLSAADLVATATALTAATIVEAYESFVLPSTPVHEVIVSGGGARNKTLLQMLRDRLPAGIQLMTTDAYGIPDEAKEAIAFAILGHETLMGRPSNVPSVTGAKRAVVLGTICY